VAEIVLHREVGLLVPPGDTGRMVEAILEILNDKKQAELFSRKGRARARAFDVTRMLERTEAVYERLSADRAGGQE
jgi:glycosyltransferase involved in cell wall biosynthesis